jgi:hypothetical protein
LPRQHIGACTALLSAPESGATRAAARKKAIALFNIRRINL